jgi:hypothetical protein
MRCGGWCGAGDADGAVEDAGGVVPQGRGEQQAGRAHHFRRAGTSRPTAAARCAMREAGVQCSLRRQGRWRPLRLAHRGSSSRASSSRRPSACPARFPTRPPPPLIPRHPLDSRRLPARCARNSSTLSWPASSFTAAQMTSSTGSISMTSPGLGLVSSDAIVLASHPRGERRERKG